MIAERRQRLGVGLIVALVWALAPPAAPAASQAVPPWAEPPEALHLTVAEADLAELYGRDPRSNDLLPGSLVHGPTGERHALEGLRFRGSSSRFHPKKSFSIRFAEPQAFLFGSSRMNLKAMYTDPTIMRETLSMAMWAELGRPAPRTKYFDLTVNGVYEGLYLHVERVDFDLIGHAGLPQRGTLVRDEFRDNPALPQSAFGYDLDDTSNPQSLLAANFDSRGDPDWGALEELVRWVHDTPAGPAFASGFRERFDAGVFVDWLAVHEVIGDIDSFADDYWLYLDHDDPAARWHVIPWDKDLAYGSHFRRSHGDTLNDFFAYEYDVERAARSWGNLLVRKVYATPELAEALRARVLDLAERFGRGWVAEQSEALAHAIRGSLETAPGPGRFRLHPQNHHGALGRLDQHLEALADFAELRQGLLARRAAPPAGDPYAGTAAVTADDEGRRLLLTDPRGWTVASVAVGRVAAPGRLTARVRPTEGIEGVDRTYVVESDGAQLTGELTLYYRNEVRAPVGVPAENWYPRDVAVGGQDDLVLASLRDGAVEGLPSRANPFSNKVAARVAVEPGTATYQLVHERAVPPGSWRNVTRIAGADRVETAVELSRAAFPGGAPVTLLARSDDYADALTGGPLARHEDAPLLLNPRADLHPSVAGELDRLGAERVVLLGGPGALSPAVQHALEDRGLATDRIGGQTRFHTAALVADRLGVTEGAFVAEGDHPDPGRGWPDALASAAAGSSLGLPVLLVTREQVPPGTAEVFRRFDFGRLTVVGGPAAVSEAVVDELGRWSPDVERVGGATRYETAALLAERVAGGGADGGRAWLATGMQFPDALAAGPASADDGGVLLLVPGSRLGEGPPAAAWLAARQRGHATVVGGTAAISSDVERAAAGLLAP